jgi:MFS transporter, DHA2 family, multidrug resistance protein
MAAAGINLSPSQHEVPGPGKWLVTAAVMSGTVLSVMDISIVNIAMPHMMGALGQDLLTITWVSTAYSIAEMIMITMTAWWSALLGRKRLLLGSIALFTVGSMLAGTSESFNQMLTWRVVQGIGGGSLIPASQAILRETFPPEEQGMAMAIYAMGVTLAPTVAPLIGGWLVDSYGWRWIFYVNVPFCIAGFMMVSAFVHDPSYLKRGLMRIDWSGIGLLTVGIIALQVVLERGQDLNWFSSHWIVLGTVIAAVAFVALIFWELGAREPVINFRLFRNLQLSVGSAIGSELGFILFGSVFLMPQFTQDLLGYSAYQAGLVTLPRALTMFMLMPLVGRLYNRVNPRLMTGAGLAALFFSQWDFAHFSLQMGFWNFLVPMVLLGLGLACTMVPISTLSLSTVPKPDMTGASGLYTLTRRIAGNVAYAVQATVVERRTQYHRATLVTNIAPYNPLYLNARTGLQARLFQFGYSHAGAGTRATALASAAVDQQATMMAFNDANWICAMMALAMIPFLLLLPKRPPLEGPSEPRH